MHRAREAQQHQGKVLADVLGWPSILFGLVGSCCLFFLFSPPAHAIMAGDEFGLPEDRPSWRVDSLGQNSPFSSVGGLGITSGSSNYFGSGVALSRNWILTAGHNVDFDDNGAPDTDLFIEVNIPGFGSYTVDSWLTNPDFNGFGNPDVHNDLALLYIEEALPELVFPSLGLSMNLGDTIALVGFGRSGYGSYGYTTDANTTDRRTGANVVDSFESNAFGNGTLFRYDFDDADTFGTPDGSLGNNVETIIGPGDSGGPALMKYGDGYALVGINTFTEGYGGLFGDIGGGVALNDQWD